MKRSNLLTFFIFFLIVLAFQIWVPHASGNDYLINVDASSHQKFGLYYPATYKFRLPPGSNGLAAQYKYSLEGTWTTLPVKTSDDTFNGIDAVRFDYDGGWAYISIGFDRASDDIYLRILDSASNPVSVTFDSIPKYYDGRKAAVSITLDDWSPFADASFRLATDYLASDGLYFTVGIITADVSWSSVQQKLDQHGKYMEVASHSVNHTEDAASYAIAGYQTEVVGSRDAIRNNLRFDANPFIPVYVEPGGYSDDTLVSFVTAGDYLVTRCSNNNYSSGVSFAEWDSTQLRYDRGAVTFTDSDETWDADLLAESNGLFDRAMADGGIYTMTNHPWSGFWYDGSYLLQHMDYIKGRNDVWYAPFGHLYLYHFLQEMRGNLSIQPVDATTTPPIANFTASPLIGAAPLSVTFSDTSTGSITDRLWNFGDSTTSSQRNPVHVYNSVGSYTVQLTASGPGGTDTKRQTGYVVVNQAAPVANFSATPRTGTIPLSVSFSDTSTGLITDWLWDFGDATTSDQENPVHIYNSAGSYTVKLTVSGPGGTKTKSRSGYVVVSLPASAANFSATPRTGTAPLSVSFSDTSTGPITGWSWDFGDATTSIEQNPVHVYNSAGSYTVKLTVSGLGGTKTKSQTAYIVVNQAPPVANFSADARSAPLTVNFSDTSTGLIASWLWNFGDATTSTVQSPTHAYKRAGSYTVQLTVTGPGSKPPSDTAVQRITVDAAASSYALTFSAGANGSLSGSASQIVNYSASASAVTAVPATGYHFVNWIGDNGFVTTTANPLTVTNVTAAQNITANFAINSYTLAYTAEPNGVIYGTTPQTVNYGGSGTQVSALADPGYFFVSWSDGVTSATRTGMNVTASSNVSASFAMKDGIILPAPGKTMPDITDALRVLSMAMGLATPTANDLGHADIAPLGLSNKPIGNGVIDIYDVIGILRMTVGLI